MKENRRAVLLIALLAWFQPGCRDAPVCDLNLAASLRLATTTSVDNSGLLAYLLPHFVQRTGIRVDVVAVGTGNALRLAENGDADAVLVHAPRAELEFVRRGAGVNRRRVMVNEFILVGPPQDPAGIAGLEDATLALERIRSSGASFVSRGDTSGTHNKELELWEAIGVVPQSGGWYIETGQGMAATLLIGSERHAYCLTDEATFLSQRHVLELETMVRGDPRLSNPYHIMAVNPQLHPETRYLEAMLLIAWITSPEGAQLIASYQQDGRTLFIPDPSDGDPQ
ncbi:MAG: substrate-binding domain-containing protein [Bradymonadales bacterium]|nr:substrate-binding domain-containing protein [Bradymonadales bacterium]